MSGRRGAGCAQSSNIPLRTGAFGLNPLARRERFASVSRVGISVRTLRAENAEDTTRGDAEESSWN